MTTMLLSPQPPAETLMRGADGALYRLQNDGHPVMVGNAAEQQSTPLQASEGIQTLLSPTTTYPPSAYFWHGRTRL